MMTDVNDTGRLMQQIERYSDAPNGERPTERQTATVLHALADYTAIHDALQAAPNEDPAAVIAHRLHALADQLESEHTV